MEIKKENTKMENFNKKTFFSTLLIIVLIFFGVWLLAAVIKPIYIASILSIVIIIMKNKTIYSGIKYYWNKLINIIFKK